MGKVNLPGKAEPRRKQKVSGRQLRQTKARILAILPESLKISAPM